MAYNSGKKSSKKPTKYFLTKGETNQDSQIHQENAKKMRHVLNYDQFVANPVQGSQSAYQKNMEKQIQAYIARTEAYSNVSVTNQETMRNKAEQKRAKMLEKMKLSLSNNNKNRLAVQNNPINQTKQAQNITGFSFHQNSQQIKYSNQPLLQSFPNQNKTQETSSPDFAASVPAFHHQINFQPSASPFSFGPHSEFHEIPIQYQQMYPQQIVPVQSTTYPFGPEYEQLPELNFSLSNLLLKQEQLQQQRERAISELLPVYLTQLQQTRDLLKESEQNIIPDCSIQLKMYEKTIKLNDLLFKDINMQENQIEKLETANLQIQRMIKIIQQQFSDNQNIKQSQNIYRKIQTIQAKIQQKQRETTQIKDQNDEFDFYQLLYTTHLIERSQKMLKMIKQQFGLYY